MDFNFINNVENCYIEIPNLLYYSHIPTAIVALLLSFFVFFKNRDLLSKILFSISIVFTLWLALNLIAWTSVDSRVIMLVGSFFGMLDSMIFLLSFYFVYVFINKKDVNIAFKLVWVILILPLIIFHAKNVVSFDMINCEATSGNTFLYYLYAFDLTVSLAVLIYGIYKYKKEKTDFKKQILLLIVGIGLFLSSYLITGSLASYLAENGYNKAFEIEQYGLFGMTFFMGVLAYLIVKYKAFDIKMIGAQALVVSLVVLVGSQFFFVQSNTNRILVAITLALVGGIGIFLIRSVKAEVQRKEELQRMSDKLAEANDQLRKLDNAKSEFISIASHQLRTPLTAIKGFISLLTEGTYGKLDQKQMDVLGKVYTSNERLIALVEDLLNISRIESGRMEFRFNSCNLTDLCRELVDTFSFKARDASLYLDFKAPEDALPDVFVDSAKVREVLSNLIDNAIKYTPKGGVTVRLERVFAPNCKIENVNGKGSVRVIVADTGIGVPAEEIPYLFSKFSRGKDVSRLNTGGTGLGLYVGRSMIEANGGKIWIESDGVNKGSRFIMEVPVEQSEANLTRWS